MATATKTRTAPAKTAEKVAESSSVVSTDSKEKKDLLSVAFEGLEAETDENPFARGSRGEYKQELIPTDHPLFTAVAETFTKEKAARLKTADPDSIIVLLRRIADQQGRAVRIAVVTLNGEKIRPVPGKTAGAPASFTTLRGKEISVASTTGKTGKFNPVTEGATVFVRFMGVEKFTRPRKGNK